MIILQKIERNITDKSVKIIKEYPIKECSNDDFKNIGAEDIYKEKLNELGSPKYLHCFNISKNETIM